MFSDSVMLNLQFAKVSTAGASGNLENGTLEIARLEMPHFQEEGFESKSMHFNLNFTQMRYWEHAISPSLLASSMKPRRLSVHHG